MAPWRRDQLPIINVLNNGWLEAGEGGPRQGLMISGNSDKQTHLYFQQEKLPNIQNVLLI